MFDPFTPVETDETNEEQLQNGIDALAVIFGLEDADLIAKRVQMYSIKEGTVISREGDQDPALYYVVKDGVSKFSLIRLYRQCYLQC